MRRRKSNRANYRSGYCMFPNHKPSHHLCRSEVQNGVAITPRVTLCSCLCHGEYEARLIAAGQSLPEEELETDDEEDEAA